MEKYLRRMLWGNLIYMAGAVILAFVDWRIAAGAFLMSYGDRKEIKAHYDQVLDDLGYGPSEKNPDSY